MISVKLNISLFAVGLCRTCQSRPAGLFGFCPEHETVALKKFFDEAVAQKQAQAETPKCFDDNRAYHEYVATYIDAASSTRSPRVDVCKDCNPAHKTKMMHENRCEHPETVFIRSNKMNGELIGVSVDAVRGSTNAWENAMMGVSGEVVSLPPHEAIAETMGKIHAAAEPKKRGPRFKKDRT